MVLHLPIGGGFVSRRRDEIHGLSFHKHQHNKAPEEIADGFAAALGTHPTQDGEILVLIGLNHSGLKKSDGLTRALFGVPQT